MAQQGPNGWPELPNALCEALDSSDASAIDGALDTVYKLYEEEPAVLEREQPLGTGHRPSDSLIPRILNHFQHPEPSARAIAVSTVNLAANYMPPALMKDLDRYIQGLFALAQDPAAAVRKEICIGLVQLIGIVPDRFEPHLSGVIEYMLASTQDPDETVAVEACEFWSAYPDSGLEVAALEPYLPRLIPVLLKNMVFDEYDEEVADAEAAEEEALSGRSPVRERDADIKPHHIGHGGGGGVSVGNGAGGGGDSTTNGEEDGGDDDDDEEIGKWNLRRCSAAGLDMLSNSFGDSLLPLLLPAVQARLAEADWRAREGAILALGAVSDGCSGGLAQHLPGIVAALLPGLQDPRPMVRCIACWALTRYARGLLDRAASGERQGIDAVVAGICERTTDHNRKVQEAACGSIASFVEEAQNEGLVYAGQIMTALGGALQRYGRRSVKNAYDAVATLAENLPDALKTREGAALILPPLFGKLATLPDGDRDLLPLLECIAAVSPSAGPQLQAFAEAAFGRCVDMADRMGAGAASGAYEKDEADEFIVGALDALCGIVEGLGAGVESLVARSALRDVIVRSCSDENHDLRQSAFALVGDLARTCIPHLKPSLAELISAALANLEPAAVSQHTISACNNAAWSLGELTMACTPEEVGQYALPALERLGRVLAVPSGGLPRSFIENSAIAVGRLCLVRPDMLALHAAAFIGPLCGALRTVRDGKEKEQAFLGICAILRANPQAGAGAFTPLCEAIVSWRQLAKYEGLRNELVQLMSGYKGQLVGLGQWETALSSLSPAAGQKLVDILGLN
jgi:transportin-1